MTRLLHIGVAFCFFASPNLAVAHGSISGMGDFYGGLLHPLLVPSHVLLWLATGFFLGQHETRQVRSALLLLLPASALGLMVSNFLAQAQLELFILCCATVLGLLVAASWKTSKYWCAFLGIIVGFSIGFDSSAEALSVSEKLVSALGSCIGIFMLSLFAYGIAEFCNNKNKYLAILIRVFGSWIAASSILVLALSI